jgi:hypothetical protein
VARSLSSVAVEHPRSCISTEHHNIYESVTRLKTDGYSPNCTKYIPWRFHVKEPITVTLNLSP